MLTESDIGALVDLGRMDTFYDDNDGMSVLFPGILPGMHGDVCLPGLFLGSTMALECSQDGCGRTLFLIGSAIMRWSHAAHCHNDWRTLGVLSHVE